MQPAPSPADRIAEAAVSSPAPEAGGPVWHTLGAGQVLQAQQVDGQRGLSPAEVASRAQRFGLNKFAEGKTESRWRAFARQYADPMQIVLLVAGIVSLYPVKELETGLVLIFLTLFNAVLGLRQEGKAAAAVAALQKMMIVKAKVTRDAELEQMARKFGGRLSAGLLFEAVACLVLAVLFKLDAIASIGSAVALVIFTLITAAHFRVRSETGANALVLALAIGAAAVALVTFVFTTLIHEPASVVALLAVLALSIGLDLWWKRVRAGRVGGGTASDVQVGN